MDDNNQEKSEQYERKIEDLKNYIEVQYENLNMEAIWLFVGKRKINITLFVAKNIHYRTPSQ